jgi:hypothetical protein
VGNFARLQIKGIDIGDAAGAVHHAVALDLELLAAGREDGAEPPACFLHPLHADAGMHLDPDALALFAHLFDGIGVKAPAGAGAALREW